MRLHSFLCLLAFAMPALHAESLDWADFTNPKSVGLTEPFAKAIAALPEADRAVAIQRLKETLASDNIEIRRRAALALGALGDQSGVPAMIQDMATKSPNDHNNIAVALRILKDPRAIPVLRESLKDKSPYIRSIALAALGEMKAKEAYADIVARLNDRQRQEGTCVSMPPAFDAVYALGLIGDPRATPILIPFLDDPEVSSIATRALTDLTGEPFGQDVAKWKTWWAVSGKK